MVHYGQLAGSVVGDLSHKLPAETTMIKSNGSFLDGREVDPLADSPHNNFVRAGAALLVAAGDIGDPQQQLVQLTSLSTTTRTRNQFYCDQCNMVFGSKSAHTSHMKSHQAAAVTTMATAASMGGQDIAVGSSISQGGANTGGDPYQCDKCNKTFAVPARLVRHYRTHTGERPFECEFCHKMFSVKENLQVHRRIHTKERPYKCDVCGRAFEHSGKLHRHMRIHTGERPHKCNICNKTFIQSGQLVIHMRTHTGEKPYRCPVDGCGKGFTCSKQLKVHSRTHTGEKPYHCDICFRDFGYNHVLKLHRVQHYGSKCYKCTICDETFKNKKEMEAHIKGHANEMPDDEQQTKSPSRDPLEVGSSNSQSALGYEGEAQNQKYRKLYDSPSSSSALQSETPRETSSEATNSDNESEYYNSYARFDYGPQSTGVALLAAASLAAAASSTSGPVAVPPTGIRAIKLEGNHAPSFLYESMNMMRPNGLAGSVQGTHNNDTTNFRASNELVKRVEAALAGAEPLLTPPRSSPESPDRSSSPESSESGVTLVRDIMSLPIRKRKLYLKDEMDVLEAESRNENKSTQRQSSVIRFAKSS